MNHITKLYSVHTLVLCGINNINNIKVTFLYSNPEFKEKWEIYARWYDMGILSPDGVSTKLANYAYEHMMDEVSTVFCVKEQIGTPEHVAEIYSNSYGFDVYAIPVQQYDFIQYKWAAGGNGISAACEHPEEAAKFIELLNTGTDIGKEIYNTVVFGLEGEHYTKDANDPNRIETLEYSGSQGSEAFVGVMPLVQMDGTWYMTTADAGLKRVVEGAAQ